MARPDFPRTVTEFQARFATEEACRAYLAASRWPEGYRCPLCQHASAFELPRRFLWQCKACGHQTSVTAGTVLHRTRTPLREWFWAAYLVTSHTPGMSALQLQRQLGIARYETAWTMLHKLRRAMLRPQREPLHGEIEVDEMYIGREEGLRSGRQVGKNRALVVGAVEVRGKGSGRVRLQVVPDASGPTLTTFVCANVSPDATIRVQGDPENASKILPRVHRVFSNLKTWLRGTHHGVDKKHLAAYVNEFTFRFNRRHSPMAAFQSLLGLIGAHSPTTYKMLYGSESTTTSVGFGTDAVGGPSWRASP